MNSPDKKVAARSVQQSQKGQQSAELEEIRNTLDSHQMAMKGYKDELVLVLDKLAVIEEHLITLQHPLLPKSVETTFRNLEVAEANLELIDLQVTPLDFKRPSIAIPGGQPFKLFVALKMTGTARMAQERFACRIAVFAKQLGSGIRVKVGEADKMVDQPGSVQACLTGKALSNGTYRFEIQTAATIPGNSAPYVARVEDGLINVY